MKIYKEGFGAHTKDSYKKLVVNIIKKNNPKNPKINPHATWIETPEDIKDSFLQAVTDDGMLETGVTPDFTADDIKKALETNTMTVYSSKPIEVGTFVTPSKMLAQDYSNSTPFSKRVSLDEIAWIAGDQGQYIGNELQEDLVYYNNNPQNKNTGDCSIRSIALATGQDYNKIKRALNAEANRLKREEGQNVPFNSLITMRNVLADNNFEEIPVPMKNMKCKDVIKRVPYVAVMVILEPVGHAVCSAGGHLYDTWDSSNSRVATLFINKRSKTVGLDETINELSDTTPIRFKAVHNYNEPEVREVCHGIKNGDGEAIKIAAEEMAPLIPNNSVLIPVPSHNGRATATLQLAEEIEKITGNTVIDALAGDVRASSYDLKKQGKILSYKDMGMLQLRALPEDKIPVFIDNVVSTGNTAKACVYAIGNGFIIAYACSTEFGSVPGLIRENYNVTAGMEDLEEAISLGKPFSRITADDIKKYLSLGKDDGQMSFISSWQEGEVTDPHTKDFKYSQPYLSDYFEKNPDLFEKCADFIRDLKFPLKIYRGLALENDSDLDINNLGHHWTMYPAVLRHYRWYAGDSGKGHDTLLTHVLIAQVDDQEQIDLQETVYRYATYTIEQPKLYENEIYITNPKTLKLLNIVPIADFFRSKLSSKEPEKESNKLQLVCDNLSYHRFDDYKQFLKEVQKHFDHPISYRIKKLDMYGRVTIEISVDGYTYTVYNLETFDNDD